MTQQTDPAAPELIRGQAVDYATGQKPTRFRWVICGLLFYATTVNYVDRSVFGVLAGDLGHVIGWQDWEFGLINAAFTLAYAIGFIIMGWLIDTVGTRAGYAIALTVWTLAARVLRWHARRSVLGLRGFAWGSARREIFQRQSRRWRNGFRSASERRRRGFLMRGQMSGRFWRHFSCR